MKQVLIFSLDNNSEENWIKYLSLVPKIDKICMENGLFIEERFNDDKNKTQEVTSYANNINTILKCTNLVNSLLNKNNLSLTCIEARQFEPPQEYSLKISASLAPGYCNHDNFKKWILCMKSIDEFAKLNDVKIQRKLFPTKFMIELIANFFNHISWSKTVYYSGNIVGRNGLSVLIEEIEYNVLKEDILDEIIKLTGKK